MKSKSLVYSILFSTLFVITLLSLVTSQADFGYGSNNPDYNLDNNVKKPDTINNINNTNITQIFNYNTLFEEDGAGTVFNDTASLFRIGLPTGESMFKGVVEIGNGAPFTVSQIGTGYMALNAPSGENAQLILMRDDNDTAVGIRFATQYSPSVGSGDGWRMEVDSGGHNFFLKDRYTSNTVITIKSDDNLGVDRMLINSPIDDLSSTFQVTGDGRNTGTWRAATAVLSPNLCYRNGTQCNYTIANMNITSSLRIANLTVTNLTSNFTTTRNLTVIGKAVFLNNISAPNICYKDGTNCTVKNIFNQSLNTTDEVTFSKMNTVGGTYDVIIGEHYNGEATATIGVYGTGSTDPSANYFTIEPSSPNFPNGGGGTKVIWGWGNPYGAGFDFGDWNMIGGLKNSPGDISFMLYDYFNSGGKPVLYFEGSTNNVLVNEDTDLGNGAKLQVNGLAYSNTGLAVGGMPDYGQLLWLQGQGIGTEAVARLANNDGSANFDVTAEVAQFRFGYNQNYWAWSAGFNHNDNDDWTFKSGGGLDQTRLKLLQTGGILIPDRTATLPNDDSVNSIVMKGGLGTYSDDTNDMAQWYADGNKRAWIDLDGNLWGQNDGSSGAYWVLVNSDTSNGIYFTQDGVQTGQGGLYDFNSQPIAVSDLTAGYVYAGYAITSSGAQNFLNVDTSITGNLNVSKDVNVSRILRAKQLDIADNATVSNLTIKDRLNVNGLTNTKDLNVSGSVNISGYVNITKNLQVLGNVSFKRAYFHGYDNSTQNFLNTANVQVVNITNNLDYDNYGINVINNQNLTFAMTGDYQLTFMPEFLQTSGTNKHVEFWLQKNGVDVPFSNTKFEISNNQEVPQSITYQFDINNPATDNVRLMWYSDSTNTQLITITGLTAPTRPSIPSVIINVQKVSELTP